MKIKFRTRDSRFDYNIRITYVAKIFTIIVSFMTIIGIPFIIILEVLAHKDNKSITNKKTQCNFFFFISTFNSFLINTIALSSAAFFCIKAIQKEGIFTHFGTYEVIGIAVGISAAISILFLSIANAIFYKINTADIAPDKCMLCTERAAISNTFLNPISLPLVIISGLSIEDGK